MELKDIEFTLPPGFRFYPTDEELVCHYLYKKMSNEKIKDGTMVEVDLHTCEPWELPEVAKLNADEWYFFSIRDRKYSTGSRTNRATKSGYWKATGKDKTVFNPSTHEIVGMRKTLVFYRGRAPNGTKSNWVMHEFRLENSRTFSKEDWVLCRVFRKRKGKEEEIINVSSSPSPIMANQPLQAAGILGELGSSLPNSPHQENSNHSSILNSYAANLMQFEPLDHLAPQYGLLLDMGLEQNGMGYMDLRNF